MDTLRGTELTSFPLVFDDLGSCSADLERELDPRWFLDRLGEIERTSGRSCRLSSGSERAWEDRGCARGSCAPSRMRLGSGVGERRRGVDVRLAGVRDLCGLCEG